MIFKRRKVSSQQLAVLLAITYKQVKITSFDFGQALIRVCFLIVSFEKFVEKLNKD